MQKYVRWRYFSTYSILASNDESIVVHRQISPPGENPTPVFLPINILDFVHLQASYLSSMIWLFALLLSQYIITKTLWNE